MKIKSEHDLIAVAAVIGEEKVCRFRDLLHKGYALWIFQNREAIVEESELDSLECMICLYQFSCDPLPWAALCRKPRPGHPS